ncbi:glycosyltransferase [Kocuria sp. p3-SID1433]|uniref:glycosyltransferase n=1 Tax=unclassified Kocuria TaxID=2649579 RepID=UPI0021A52A2E|nr:MULTISPECIES: glycosyltransferase [unclassified Kocuria]MCT1602135.1 glycosyltransferase [Kocuria sp. p3-SID1428]MCT2179610.1 glycosyltransferase [Kocuria sp. p3-SID1433]
MSRRDRSSRGVRVIVVCPTEYGGQIEHAADLAMGLAADPRTERVVLVSRRGADAYLGRPQVDGLSIVETIPPRRTGTGLLTRGLQVVDLVREHLQIRRLAAQAGPGTVLALDSSKYPFPSVLTPLPGQTAVLFLHNVRPHHDDAESSLRLRLLRRLELGAATGCDRVVVHGRDQQVTAYENLGRIRGDLVAVALPTSSRIDEAATAESVPVSLDDDGDTAPARLEIPARPYALVLGELRANKGIELAIDAAGQAGVPLLVAGRAESPELASTLRERARHAGTVMLEDRFLERGEFQRILEGAAVVVLPYTHFDAQSGILAKAIAAGLPIVASDLDSLREQNGEHRPARFADIHDRAAFAAALRQGYDRAVAAGPRSGPGGTSHADWDPSVDAVLSASARG